MRGGWDARGKDVCALPLAEWFQQQFWVPLKDAYPRVPLRAVCAGGQR